MAFLNSWASMVLDWFPSLKGAIPSTESFIPETTEAEGEFLHWVDLYIDNHSVIKYDAEEITRIKSFEFTFTPQGTEPKIVNVLEEMLKSEFEKQRKNGIVLIKFTLHGMTVPDNTEVHFESLINGRIKKNFKISSDCEIVNIYKLNENLEKDILSACGKEKILGTIRPDFSGIKILRTVEDNKYLGDNGNMMIHKDTFISRFILRNKNHEWQHKTIVKMYKVRDRPNCICFKKDDYPFILTGLKEKVFDKIVYLKNKNSISIQITRIKTESKKGRIKIMLKLKLAYPNIKIHLNQTFQKIKV